MLLLLPFLASCSLQMQQASRPWDDVPHKTTVARKSKSWRQTHKTPKASKPTAPRSKVKPARRSTKSGGLVPVPELSEEDNGFTREDAQERPVSATAAAILASAEKHLGVPYVYGGASPAKGFDCSGLVFHVFKENGKSIHRTADKQFLQGQEVSKEEMQPGDLVFFSHSGKFVDHVGIYAGDQLFIHAPRTGRTVSYDSLDTGYYRSHFRGSRRFH